MLDRLMIPDLFKKHVLYYPISFSSLLQPLSDKLISSSINQKGKKKSIFFLFSSSRVIGRIKTSMDVFCIKNIPIHFFSKTRNLSKVDHWVYELCVNIVNLRFLWKNKTEGNVKFYFDPSYSVLNKTNLRSNNKMNS